MLPISDTIDAAIRETMTARSLVSKIKVRQVTGIDAIASLKATALAWFNTHRGVLTSSKLDIDLSGVDSAYQIVLDSTAKKAARTHISALLNAKNAWSPYVRRSPRRFRIT